MKMAHNLGQWRSWSKKIPSERNQPELLQRYQKNRVVKKSFKLKFITKIANKKVRNQKRIHKIA